MLEMMVIGADTHKRQHTLAGVDEVTGRVAGEKTVPVKRAALQDMVRWARSLGEDRVWAIEDCRHVSGGLERFLLVCGERVVRVPPMLMAGMRRGAREVRRDRCGRDRPRSDPRGHRHAAGRPARGS